MRRHLELDCMTQTQPMNRPIESQRFARFGAIALVLSGLLFFLYPTVRPWHDESTVGGAEASMSSNAWVVAHLFAMLALILMPLGMLALSGLLAEAALAGWLAPPQPSCGLALV
jgi:hypothetical protein